MSNSIYPVNAHTTVIQLPQKFITVQLVHDLVYRESETTPFGFTRTLSRFADEGRLTWEQAFKVLSFHMEQGAPTRTAAEVVATSNVVYSL